jgi:hypothetical protein
MWLMTEVIFDEMTAARRAALAEGDRLVTSARTFLAHLHHHNQEGTTMTIEEFETDIQAKVQAGMDKAADVYNHLKAIAEEDLPKAAQIQQSPVAQELEGIFLPPEIEAELTGIARTYAARFGTPVAATPAPAPAAAEAPADGLPAQ